MKRLSVTFDDDTINLLERAAVMEKRSVANLINWICYQEARRITAGKQLDVETYTKKGPKK